MSFVFDIKKDKLGVAKAIEHFDGTARVQSISKHQNENYYNLIHEFYKESGIPLVLNTSFNDREPIVETPGHAIDCFLRTDIDYLYFCEWEILVSKRLT
jgi:carbamoyltransferase